jgi:hypothetical protein
VGEQFPGREFSIEFVNSDDAYNGPTLYLMRGPRPDPQA